MRWPILQHGFTSGHHLSMAMALTIGLALSSQAAVARECQRETPLPADVRLIPPGPQVPEAVARFAGVWIGTWLGEGGETLCHTLVVEEVLANGYARVIYSIGTYAEWSPIPHFWRATGQIVDGALRFTLPIPEHSRLAYRFVGEILQGTYNDAGHVSLTRVADVRQVSCGPQGSGPPPAPPATGPRTRLTAAELLAPEAGPEPVHNAYFLPVGQATPALHAFKADFRRVKSAHIAHYEPQRLQGIRLLFVRGSSA